MLGKKYLKRCARFNNSGMGASLMDRDTSVTDDMPPPGKGYCMGRS